MYLTYAAHIQIKDMKKEHVYHLDNCEEVRQLLSFLTHASLSKGIALLWVPRRVEDIRIRDENAAAAPLPDYALEHSRARRRHRIAKAALRRANDTLEQ